MKNIIIKAGSVLVCHRTDLQEYDFGYKFRIAAVNEAMRLVLAETGGYFTIDFLESAFANDFTPFIEDMYDKLFAILERR